MYDHEGGYNAEPLTPQPTEPAPEPATDSTTERVATTPAPASPTSPPAASAAGDAASVPAYAWTAPVQPATSESNDRQGSGNGSGRRRAGTIAVVALLSAVLASGMTTALVAGPLRGTAATPAPA